MPPGDETARPKAQVALVLLAISVALLIAASTAIATGVLSPPDVMSFADTREDSAQGLSYADVRDMNSAAQYLSETIDIFLPSSGSYVGDFSYLRVPVDAILTFQDELGVADEQWRNIRASTAIVLLWVPSTEIHFRVPRPRYGFDPSLPDADAFVVLIDPESGFEARALTSSNSVDHLVEAAVNRQGAKLAVEGSGED